jgi:N-dimethylarginine dimethylaminohydrolase
MTYSVYQHWDPLKVCVVGRSYPPEFYSWIKSSKLRNLFERIAIETEEDFQTITETLKKFNVEVVRPNVPNILVDDYLTSNLRVPGPVSMNPRDQMIMIGETFFLFPYNSVSLKTSGRNITPAGWTPFIYDQIKGQDWPQEFTAFDNLPLWIRDEVRTLHKDVKFAQIGEDLDEMAAKAGQFNWWQPILDQVTKAGNKIVTNFADTKLDAIPANGITRIGKDLYFGCDDRTSVRSVTQTIADTYFADYRCHFVTTGGHIDGVFTPVHPGLIVSVADMKSYEKTFPDWEVVYLANESWHKVADFLALKKKNQGRWWIKDYEHDHELIDLVETWLKDWTGYAEESVFDVNMLVIDQKNVIVNGYNKQVFDAFERYGITAHICPVRHRYFWDGGVHCITLDLHREGSIKDYFPERTHV